MADKLPLHAVCDYSDDDFVWIVTVYIPQDATGSLESVAGEGYVETQESQVP